MTETGGMSLILELVDRLARSWWTVVAGLCLGVAGSVLAMRYLPKTFEATTKILVSPPTISQDLVKSTAGDDMEFRFAALKEAVLSRPYMLTLIDKTYGPQKTQANTERLIQQIRNRVTVKVERYGGGGGYGDRAGMFSLGFLDSDADRAAQVVNDWADLYIRENTKHRTSRAEETTSTLEDLAGNVRKQLAEKERAISEFRSAHLYELPERNDTNVALLNGRQRDLEANQKAVQSSQDRVQLLQAQLQASLAGSAAGSSMPLDPSSARLAQLQRELAGLKSRYSDEHPEVRAKEREVQEAMGAVRPVDPSAPPGKSPVALSPLEQEIQNQTKEVARLQLDQVRIQHDIDLYKARIEAAPQVQLQLEERTKGYDVLQKQYNDYQMKAQAAKGAETIETAQKGERFEVIERAVPPAFPIQPKPFAIFGVGVALGLILFVGPVLLVGFIHPTVQSEEGLRASLPVPLLVSIPRIETESTRRLALRRRTGNLVLSGLSVAFLVVVCVFNYTR